jgi:hypothetical protein
MVRPPLAPLGVLFVQLLRRLNHRIEFLGPRSGRRLLRSFASVSLIPNGLAGRAAPGGVAGPGGARGLLLLRARHTAYRNLVYCG